MSNDYRTRSSRHEKRLSRRARNDFDIVEATAEQTIRGLDESEFTQSDRSARRREAGEKLTTLSVKTVAILAGVSIVFSLSFYAFPFWQQLATPLQSQNLYSGLAMSHGLAPFNDFFGTGGSLFYVLNWLGNITGGTLVLWLLETIALFSSGIFTFLLVAEQTNNENAATLISNFTLIIVAGLARGGDAPTLFALPFALWAVKFLNDYFREDSSDRGFIRFGMAGAITFVISPVMSLFFVFSVVALLIYNVTHRRFGHGFYQMLAGILGVILIGYSIAYYALDAQTLYTSIEQSVLIPFTHFGPTENLLLVIAKAVVLTLIFGIVTGFVQGVLQLKTAGHALIWYVLLLIGTLVVTTMIIFESTFDSSNLLAVLPFTVVFSGLGVKNTDKVFIKYLQNRLFAPILGIIFIIAAPFTYYYLNKPIFTEEKAVAQFIQENSRAKDRVFVLGADKNINNLTRKSASLDSVPENYPIKFTQSFDVKAGSLQDKFVVIEAGHAIPAPLKTVLTTSYKPAAYAGEHFLVYQKK